MGVITNAQEVMRYRNLIKQLAIRDLKLKYERSALGFLWSLLNPLVMISIYTFFFSMVLRLDIEKFWLFLVAVLLPWNFLSKGIQNISQIPYQSGYLLNRAAFPSESLVFSGMLSAFSDFCLEMTILIIILAILGLPLFPGLFLLPLVMLIHFMFTTGMVLIFSVGNVFYRDTQHIAQLLCAAWLYLTPVFYQTTMVPEKFQLLYHLNPMVHIAGCFREIIYLGNIPNFNTLGIAATVAFGAFTLGWLIFMKFKSQFAEII